MTDQHQNSSAFIIVEKDSFLAADLKEAISLQFPHAAVFLFQSVEDAKPQLDAQAWVGAVFVAFSLYEDHAAWLAEALGARGAKLVITGAPADAILPDSGNIVALSGLITNDVMTALLNQISDHQP